MSKQHSLSMEQLLHDVIERIMEMLPVKSLLRFKAVSKQWQSTIESRFFQENQLRQREKSRDPDVLMVCVSRYDVRDTNRKSLRTLVLGDEEDFESLEKVGEEVNEAVDDSSPGLVESLVLMGYMYLVEDGGEGKEDGRYSVCWNSCDGLVCLYHTHKSCIVVNPATRWHRALPLCHLQQRMNVEGDNFDHKVGFGKDKLTGIYKPVWLYINVGRDATICEVFDFSTNTWRYTTASAPYWISYYHDPVYVDGLLHWFTQCKETKVMSLDLHTETFQVIYKVPFTDVDPYHMIMCNLDDRLCISQKKKSKQVIWLFSSGNKTWDKMCSIDLELTSFQFGISMSIPFLPLALLERKKLLIFPRYFGTTLVIHDLETKSYDAAFSDAFIGYPVCYFQSLISIL
ncbi:hypothetical protein Bca101_052974 [Brassica carinata]